MSAGVTSSKPAPRRRTQPGREQVTQRASVDAGLGGIGGGTGMIAIAQLIGTDTLWGNVILYVAPTVSVVAGITFFQIRLQAAWYAERWQIRRARKTLENQLANATASEAHKSRIRD